MVEQIGLKCLKIEYMTMDVFHQKTIYCLGPENPRLSAYQSGPVEPIESFSEVGHPFFIPAKVQSSRMPPSSGLQLQ